MPFILHAGDSVRSQCATLFLPLWHYTFSHTLTHTHTELRCTIIALKSTSIHIWTISHNRCLRNVASESLWHQIKYTIAFFTFIFFFFWNNIEYVCRDSFCLFSVGESWTFHIYQKERRLNNRPVSVTVLTAI